ncbi:hypothetical protein BDZ89DRAFT_1141187 [Hymenopellis radicata]|nr:hypothetical protein BDZ89DRAFT_1141187 [Hymenopellis radicata]
MAPRSSKKQTEAAEQSTRTKKTKVQKKKGSDAEESTAATTSKARGKKGKKAAKDAKDVEENDNATVSNPTPVGSTSTPAESVDPPIDTNQPTTEAVPSTSQDDFSDIKPNDLRVIRVGAQEMSSGYVAAHPGGISKEDEYPVEDKEKYDLHRARLELLQKRTPAFPLPCSLMRTRGRTNLDGVAERELTDLSYAPWTKAFDGPNNAAKKFPCWWAPIDKVLFEQCWTENVPNFKEKDGGREGRPWEFQNDEYREMQLKQWSPAQLWGLDYDSETWPSAQSDYTDPDGVVHHVGAEWVKFREAEMKKQEGRSVKSCLVVKGVIIGSDRKHGLLTRREDADETTVVNSDEDGSVVRESSADDEDTLMEDGNSTSDDATSKATTSRSTGVRFTTPSTSGSKRRRDEVEEEEEEVEGRSSRRQRTDGAHVLPAPSESPRRSARSGAQRR